MDTTPAYTGPERRRSNADRYEEIERRFAEGADEMQRLREEIKGVSNTVSTILCDTKELVGLLNNAKGAFRVLNGIAALAKPITAIVVLCTAIWGAIFTFKHGGLK